MEEEFLSAKDKNNIFRLKSYYKIKNYPCY